MGVQETMKKRYDAEYFDEYKWNNFYLLNTAILKNFLKIPDGASLLDVGCGRGYHVKGWRMNNVEAHGIDKYSTELGEFCERGDVLDIPYEEDSFEVVTCMDVLEHVKESDLPRAISELRSVGTGWLIIQVLFSDEDHHKELFDRDKTHKIWKPKKWWLEQLETDKYGYVLKPFEITIKGHLLKFPYPDQLIITRCEVET